MQESSEHHSSLAHSPSRPTPETPFSFYQAFPNHNPYHKNESAEADSLKYCHLTKVFITSYLIDNLVSYRPFFFLLFTVWYEVLQNFRVQTRVRTAQAQYQYGTYIHLIIVAALHTGIRPVHTAHCASCSHGRSLKRNWSGSWRNHLRGTAAGSRSGGFSRPCP